MQAALAGAALRICLRSGWPHLLTWPVVEKLLYFTSLHWQRLGVGIHTCHGHSCSVLLLVCFSRQVWSASPPPTDLACEWMHISQFCDVHGSRICVVNSICDHAQDALGRLLQNYRKSLRGCMQGGSWLPSLATLSRVSTWTGCLRGCNLAALQRPEEGSLNSTC